MDEKQVLLEAWKQTVAVQSHFNEIAMKIRAFALTLVAALVTADSLSRGAHSWLAVVAALIAWGAFYLMDRWHYHYLLLGAVDHGEALERKTKEFGWVLSTGEPMLGLSLRISAMNQEAFGLKAKFKIDIFYAIVAACLLIVLFVRLMGSTGT